MDQKKKEKQNEKPQKRSHKMVANVEILWRFYWNRQSMMYRSLCTIRFHINRNVYDALEHVMDFQIGQIHAVIDDLSNGLFM